MVALSSCPVHGIHSSISSGHPGQEAQEHCHLACTSRLFFSDKALSGTAGDEKIHAASWCLEVLHKLRLLPSKLIKKHGILEWGRVTGKLSCDETQLIKQCCTRGALNVRDEYTAALELISPVSGWEELGS